MALLDKLGEIVKTAATKTEEITKTIGEKAEAAMEIQKLTMLVNKEESKIESTYKKIGKMVFEKSHTCDSMPEVFKEECDAIKASLAEIEELKFKISSIKATAFNGDIKATAFNGDEPKVNCPNCGAAVGVSAKFCSECGAKMEPVETAKTVEAEVVEGATEHKPEAEAEVEVITPEAKPAEPAAEEKAEETKEEPKEEAKPENK